MSSHIYYKDESLWMSNQRLSTLPPFAFKVGDAIAKTPGDTEFLRQLREWTETEWFNGYDLDLAGRFPTDTCRRFWATVFFEVARRIFLRTLGDQETASWQPSAICDAHLIGRMLSREEPDPAAPHG